MAGDEKDRDAKRKALGAALDAVRMHELATKKSRTKTAAQGIPLSGAERIAASIVAFRPSKPTWKRYRPFHRAQLWEAVALSLNLDPGGFYPDQEGRIGNATLEKSVLHVPAPFQALRILDPSTRYRLEERLRIAVDHLGDSLPILEESPGHEWLTIISFPAFATWAIDKLGFKLPDKFPWRKPAADTGTLSRSPSAPADKRRWPWGNYETDLLRHLAAVAESLWGKYDPARPKSAPTNARVIEWLVERGVKERSAQAIAKILHADDLAPGPRPQK